MNNEIVKKYYDDARKMIDSNYPEQALQCVRNCLEAALKTICKINGLEYETDSGTDSATSLHDMIDSLLSAGIISDYEAGILHETRQLGNSVNHVSIDNITVCSLDDARRGYNNLQTVIGIMERVEGASSGGISSGVLKDPMLNPKCYGENRRYWGKWSDCISKEAVLMIPEYVQLYNSAVNENDMDAMLDLASGFLSNKTTWNPTGLINMPSCSRNGKTYNNDKCYDERYYYWINYAVETALTEYDKGAPVNSYTNKYLCTALLEYLKYRAYRISSHYYNPSALGDGVRVDPFDIAEGMFDSFKDVYFVLGILDPHGALAASMLIDMITLYGAEAIDLIHRKNEADLIREIKYMYYLIAGKNEVGSDVGPIPEKLALSVEDIGKVVSKDMISKYRKSDPVITDISKHLSSQEREVSPFKLGIRSLKEHIYVLIVVTLIIFFICASLSEVNGDLGGAIAFVITAAFWVYVWMQGSKGKKVLPKLNDTLSKIVGLILRR